MTTIKLDSKPARPASAALEPLVGTLYGSPGVRIVGVIELRHVERNQVVPDTEKEPWVKLQVTALEIARDDQEEALRRALRALFMHRTSAGTFDVDGQLTLTERTLDLAAGELHAIEAARLRVALSHWADYAHRVLHTNEITRAELLHELKTVIDGLDAVLHRTRDDDSDEAGE